MATLFYRKAKYKMICLITIRKFGDTNTACCYVGVEKPNKAYGVHYEDLNSDIREKLTYSGHLPNRSEWFFGYDFEVREDSIPIKYIMKDLDSIASKLKEFQ